MFCPFSREKNWHKLRKVCDNQIDKPQRGRPKKAELPDVNINTGAQSINTERASLSVAEWNSISVKLNLLQLKE